MTQDPETILSEEMSEDGTRSWLDRWLVRFARFISWAIFIAFIIAIVEVISRYGFNRPTLWVHESTTFLIAMIFLVGGPVALARDKHIRVRIIYDTVPPGVRRWLDVINSLIAIAFFGSLTYAAWTMVWSATHTPTGDLTLERTGTAWNPPTPTLLKMIMLICVCTMLVQTVLHLIAAITRKAPRNEGRR